MQLEDLVSKLDRVEYLLKHMPGRHNQKMHTPLKYITGGGAVSLKFAEGAEQAMRRVGLKKNDIIRMHSLRGLDTTISVIAGSANNGVLVESQYRTSGGGSIGNAIRKYYLGSDGRIAHNIALGMAADMQSTGYASTLYANQIMTLQDRGYHAIMLSAGGLVGRYAWARKGFNYVDPEHTLPKRNRAFLAWTEHVGLEQPSEGWPYFRSAKEFADYDPGIRVSRETMPALNSSVYGDDFPVGKAFMLDGINGHGEWDGILRLQND